MKKRFFLMACVWGVVSMEANSPVVTLPTRVGPLFNSSEIGGIPGFALHNVLVPHVELQAQPGQGSLFPAWLGWGVVALGGGIGLLWWVYHNHPFFKSLFAGESRKVENQTRQKQKKKNSNEIKTHRQLACYCNIIGEPYKPKTNSSVNECLIFPKVVGEAFQRKGFEDHIFDRELNNIRVIGVCDGHAESSLQLKKINEWNYKFFEHPRTQCQGYLPCVIGERLPVYLEKALEKVGNNEASIIKIIQKTFVHFNNESVRKRCELMAKIMDQDPTKDGQGGSTCSLVIILPGTTPAEDKVIVAHVGDSPVVVSKKDKSFWRSRDHSAADSNEQERIKKAGGEILNNRLQGNLMVTRAFGDLTFAKYGLIAEPEVTIFKRDELTGILLCTDGLVDALKRKANSDTINPSQLNQDQNQEFTLLKKFVQSLLIVEKNKLEGQAHEIFTMHCAFSPQEDPRLGNEDDASFQFILF